MDDGDYDETGTEDSGEPNALNASGWRGLWQRVHPPALTSLQRSILKCSIAYLVASAFTYNDTLSSFVALFSTAEGPDGEKHPSPSGHMVATVAVYFNPAKTLGGMLEADTYCLYSLAFVSFVSLGSMNLYWAIEPHPGWEWLADVLAILWVGVGMSCVAWIKVWMEKPTFNTACSMFSIILFIVVVKEGGLRTLASVSFIVFIGTCVSNLVCYTVWPQSATANLEKSMVKTLDSYSTLLKLVTNTFLLEEPAHRLSQEKIKNAVADHQASFTQLKKNLSEARSERVCGGPADGPGRLGTRRPYEDAVDSLTRLGQHLNGLRSGITLQYDIARAYRDGRLEARKRSSRARSRSGTDASDKGKTQGRAGNGFEDEETVVIKAVATIFGGMVDELGPPLQALSTTCTRAIKRLREAFVHRGSTQDPEVLPNEFLELVEGIERQMFQFESTSNQAVLRASTRGASGFTSRASFASIADENPILAGATDHENVFLVYFFIFTLQEFASELVNLVDAMSRIYAAERLRAKAGPWYKRPVRLLGCIGRRLKKGNRDMPGLSSKQPRPAEYLLATDSTRIAAHFPKVRPHAPNTIQTPAYHELSLYGRLKQWVWRVGARATDGDIKYAVKVGMATAILAAPAFFETTRPTFLEYRGEWALISFFVVMSPTIGGTNLLGVHRVLGTLLGAATAAAVYTFFSEQPLVLALFGFLFSIPCFYLIVATPQFASTGRFVLLTYNLTCLYSYNIRKRPNVWVIEIAWHRFIAVTIGVLWAAFVSRFWWPSEARRELSRALGEFCLNIGWLYTRLAASNSFAPKPPSAGEDGLVSATEETALVPRKPKTELSNSIEEFMAMELHLQIQLIKLQDLLKQTQHEPRLKGPFPIKLYRSILASLQTILDRLHSMRCVTTREEWCACSTVRRDFIAPTNKQRRELVGNVVLYFSVLSSAFRLKAPLPPYLPPAESARQDLVAAIRKLDVVRNRDIKGSRQLLFFAYALTMKGITQELSFLGKTSQEAFGVIGPSVQAFEEMFVDDARSAQMV
ncbi:Fusaric acid resistance protein-like-domain-containing protein [Vararia minispora EC-137]|uniref:Fusaric acid resistance protein-like-domain-containing protein n=1 Tax=Vararia minispora EC-137 TaxID=1314806 RepID=A0ACB8QMK2_9AGAM|nr:Fusaric acid resistance protein-like-domain-containing protein [Vararia minispora EC-137]